MSLLRDYRRALYEHDPKAELVRKTKHGFFYRLSDGRHMLVPGSPGDRRSGLRNFIADLNRKTPVCLTKPA